MVKKQHYYSIVIVIQLRIAGGECLVDGRIMSCSKQIRMVDVCNVDGNERKVANEGSLRR